MTYQGISRDTIRNGPAGRLDGLDSRRTRSLTVLIIYTLFFILISDSLLSHGPLQVGKLRVFGRRGGK